MGAIDHLDTSASALAIDRVFGLDIETDTSRGGLDPSQAPIVAVALCGNEWSSVFDGDEADILVELDAAIAALPAGVIVTWNGSRFDLPFIADRAAMLGLSLGLQLAPDPHHRSRHEPLPGHAGGYIASWHRQRHLDAYAVYRADVGASLGIPCGLRAALTDARPAPRRGRPHGHPRTLRRGVERVRSERCDSRPRACIATLANSKSFDRCRVASG